MDTPFLVWLDRFSVGHVGLDAQHRQLVALINEIHSAESDNETQDKLQALLHAFEIAAVSHYKNENSIMRLFGEWAEGSQSGNSTFLQALSEAHVNEHYADHARSLVALDSIIHASGNDLASRNCSMLLKDWFIEHASTKDVHLKAVFSARSRDG